MEAKSSTKPVGGGLMAPAADKLIDFRAVNALLGLRCRTSHTARALARRGQIRAVRLNERVVRYSLASVVALVGNEVGEASRDGNVAAAEGKRV